jgi:hypothetical protein
MGSQGTQLQMEPVRGESLTQPWSATTRVAFRFCFVYFGLYCLFTQISVSLIPVFNIDIPDPSSLWPMHQLVTWTAAHVLRIAAPVTYVESGSGDRMFDWDMLFCLLVIAAVATLVWSTLDRKRENYVTLYKWFRLAIRICLAGQMFNYGLAKVVPLQMPYPYLTKLIEPFGNFSPMGVLWASIGSSPAYEVFAGSAEMLGGILLIVPRTTMLGAMVCMADMTQVFMLNMTYDVPVKLLSFHLLLLSLFLLAPDVRRLVNLFFLDRPAGPSTQPPLFATRRANRIAVAAQIIFCATLVLVSVYGSWKDWHKFGDGRPKSALYGIWEVEKMTIDGQIRSPLLTDYGRWRRVIFDFPTRVSFQRMDSSFAPFGAAIDANKKTIALTKDGDKNWKSDFTYQSPAPNQLILDGTMDGRKVHMQLQLLDRNKLLLVSRGFHWVQEKPYNR